MQRIGLSGPVTFSETCLTNSLQGQRVTGLAAIIAIIHQNAERSMMIPLRSKYDRPPASRLQQQSGNHLG